MLYEEFEERYIGHVYMKSLKKIHRTCYIFEENK